MHQPSAGQLQTALHAVSVGIALTAAPGSRPNRNWTAGKTEHKSRIAGCCQLDPSAVSAVMLPAVAMCQLYAANADQIALDLLLSVCRQTSLATHVV